MSENQSIKNIYQRILGVMGDVSYIQKEEKKPGLQYAYVAHDKVAKELHKPLVKHGIAVIPTVKSILQEGEKTTVCLMVAFINVDDPDDRIIIESWGYGYDKMDKGPGKAVSYAYKYALLKTFCLETGDDPDQDQTISKDQWISILPFDDEYTKDYKAQVFKALKIEGYYDIPLEKFDTFFEKLKQVHTHNKAKKQEEVKK
jgi:hypothetical protein